MWNLKKKKSQKGTYNKWSNVKLSNGKDKEDKDVKNELNMVNDHFLNSFYCQERFEAYVNINPCPEVIMMFPLGSEDTQKTEVRHK